MRYHHRRIAVVRVQDFQVWRGRADPGEQLANGAEVDIRRRRGAEADRLVAEEVRLASEAEIHGPESCETPDFVEDARYLPESWLAVHRLDAERAAFVDVPHAPFRCVKLDGERLREIGMGTDHVGTEHGPPVPLLDRAVAVRPVARHQVVVHGHIDFPQRDPVERLDEGFVVISEPSEWPAEDPRSFEPARVMDDLLFADRQTAEILARNDGAREEDEHVAVQRMAREDLIVRDV